MSEEPTEKRTDESESEGGNLKQKKEIKKKKTKTVIAVRQHETDWSLVIQQLEEKKDHKHTCTRRLKPQRACGLGP